MGDCNLVLDVTIILKITFFFLKVYFLLQNWSPNLQRLWKWLHPRDEKKIRRESYPTSSACEHDWLARKPTTVLLKGHLEDLAFCPSKQLFPQSRKTQRAASRSFCEGALCLENYTKRSCSKDHDTNLPPAKASTTLATIWMVTLRSLIKVDNKLETRTS